MPGILLLYFSLSCSNWHVWWLAWIMFCIHCIDDQSSCFWSPSILRSSYAIFSWLNSIVIFNITPADIKTKSANVILKMTTILKELRIAQLCSKNGQTLPCLHHYNLLLITTIKNSVKMHHCACSGGMLVNANPQ